MRVYLESGKKKVFASAEEWPGWSRSGKDENMALNNLYGYLDRYLKVLHTNGVGFKPPENSAGFIITAEYKGCPAADFGVPGVIPDIDRESLPEDEFTRQCEILAACWAAFDRAVQSGQGRELHTGPRGGGRDLDKILEHVLGAELGYLASIGWRTEPKPDALQRMDPVLVHQEILRATEIVYHDPPEERGPRGGLRWPLRYFFRRDAWHVLDHAWEIEDRTI